MSIKIIYRGKVIDEIEKPKRFSKPNQLQIASIAVLGVITLPVTIPIIVFGGFMSAISIVNEEGWTEFKKTLNK